MAAIERLRAGNPALAIFAVASAADPELILQAMRAGANEFFAWPTDFNSPAARSMQDAFQGAVRRTAARREATVGASKPACVTRISRREEAAQHHRGCELRRWNSRALTLDRRGLIITPGVALFLGVRPRFTVLGDRNLHRLDRTSEGTRGEAQVRLDIWPVRNSSIVPTGTMPRRSKNCSA
jgi:hypothetical protein